MSLFNKIINKTKEEKNNEKIQQKLETIISIMADTFNKLSALELVVQSIIEQRALAGGVVVDGRSGIVNSLPVVTAAMQQIGVNSNQTAHAGSLYNAIVNQASDGNMPADVPYIPTVIPPLVSGLVPVDSIKVNLVVENKDTRPDPNRGRENPRMLEL